MCGRTSLFVAPADLEDRFDATVPEAYEPRYNIAPADPIEVITADKPDTVQRFTWGLLPHWAEDPSDGLINARSESVAEKPAFRDAWESRPCLVLSSGFYEWDDGPGPNQPYRVYREDDPAFAMAGLWQEWEHNGRSRRTVTILTTEANDRLESIHDRMAVLLPREDEQTWLTADPTTRRDLCRPYDGGDLDMYPISTRVNDPANDDPGIIDPADTEQSDLGAWG